MNKKQTMTQGEFTAEEAKESKKALKEIMEAFPKSKYIGYIGHFNDIFLFLDSCIINIKNK